MMLGALLAGSSAHLLPGVGVLITAVAVAVAAVARLGARPRRLRVDGPLLMWVLLAAMPAIGYARRMASSTVDMTRTWNLDHYPIQAALGIAVVLVAGVNAIARELSGARLATVTLVASVAWIGLESAVYPHRLGSVGTVWGWVAVGWALTFLVLALRPRASRRADGAQEPARTLPTSVK